MRVLIARNVHEALPLGLRLLEQEGLRRESRNGPVLVSPWPVTTVYERPCERVLFWPERDANPFFHLYESLWMLAGRNDVKPLLRYAKNMASFSDDGRTLHGAYGYRWRRWFEKPLDQLMVIAQVLRENPDDRRSILQMWDASSDLGKMGKDLPCNTMASFQRDAEGRLNLTVFCRSNDIIWGAYGANAVHFSMLLEYMALWIGCPVGVYNQVSVNWHGYLNTLAPLEGKWRDWIDFAGWVEDPYQMMVVKPTLMADTFTRVGDLNEAIKEILDCADTEHMRDRGSPSLTTYPWTANVWKVLEAHEAYRNAPKEQRYDDALKILDEANQENDWVVAAQQWFARRAAKQTGEPQSSFYPRSRYGSKL
jgi:Thymidylate synthase